MVPRAWCIPVLAALAAAAQDPPPITIKVDVALVNTGFSVRDAEGRLVDDLAEDDFELYEDGVRQQVQFFARKEQRPLTLGLIVDMSRSQIGHFRRHRETSISFLKNLLSTSDRGFLLALDTEIRIVSDFTHSRASLEQAIRRLEPRNLRQYPIFGPPVVRGNASPLLDAVFLACGQRLAGAPGRKALVLLSDGEDAGSLTTLLEAVEALQSTATLFYGLRHSSVRFKATLGFLRPDVFFVPNRIPALVRASGGREFPSGADPPRAFGEIETELRTMYEIAYASSHPENDGRFRKIEIRPRRPGLIVRAKPGYYSR